MDVGHCSAGNIGPTKYTTFCKKSVFILLENKMVPRAQNLIIKQPSTDKKDIVFHAHYSFEVEKGFDIAIMKVPKYVNRSRLKSNRNTTPSTVETTLAAINTYRYIPLAFVHSKALLYCEVHHSVLSLCTSR